LPKSVTLILKETKIKIKPMTPQKQQLLLASENLISLSEAARFTPYSPEYLGLLARKGKLEAIKISRDWMTTKEIILAYVQKQKSKQQKFFERFQSLKNATHIQMTISNAKQAGFAGLKVLIFLGIGIVATSALLTFIKIGLIPNQQYTIIPHHHLAATTPVPSSGGIKPSVLGDSITAQTTTPAPLTGLDISAITQLIKDQLNQYLLEGKFKSTGDSTPGFAGPNGMVQNGNGRTTSVIGGTPIVSYYPAVPSQNFSGASLAGFTDLSAGALSSGNTNISGTLNVTGQTSMGDLTDSGNAAIGGTFSAGTSSLSSLTVSGQTIFTGSTTIAGLTVTGLNPGLTLGSVAFQGAAGLSQDNANLFYDSTNHRLGLGTSTPSAQLTIQGTSTAPTVPLLTIASSSGASLLTVLPNGNVGIGTSSSSAKLAVAGNVSFDSGAITTDGTGNLTVNGVATLNSVNVAGPIYTNGPANGNVDGWAINYGFEVSNSFVVSGSHTIKSFSFASWLNPGDTWTSVTWVISSAPCAKGDCGTIYGSATSTVSDVLDFVNSFTFEIHTDTVTGLNIPLTAGTYWLTLKNAVLSNGDGVFWDQTKPDVQSAPYGVVNGDPGIAYHNTLGPLAPDTFTIYGDGGTTIDNNGITSGAGTFGLLTANAGSDLDRGLIVTDGAGNLRVSGTLIILGTASSTSATSTSILPLFTIASSSGDALLTVIPSGNVGIGTTTPTQTLSVAGNMQLTGALFDANNASGTAGQILTSTGTGTAWSSTSTLATSLGAFIQGGNTFGATGTLGTLDNNDLNIITNGSTKMTVTAGGNVGIGATDVTAKLSVSNLDQTQASLLLNQQGGTFVKRHWHSKPRSET
jgi:hypothetical protein